MRRLSGRFVGIVALWCMLSPLSAQESLSEVQTRLRADLGYLADDAREGRGVGTQGLQDAGDFIAKRFSELGLDTKVFGGSPFQEFTVPHGFAAAKPADDKGEAKNWLKIEGSSIADLALETQWNPLAVGSNGPFQGEVVFAGYGITAKEFNYDDYADLDVKGKVVIVIRREPQNADGSNIFGTSGTSRYAYFNTKEVNAVQHGAAALIIVNDAKTAEQTEDRVLAVTDAGRPLPGSQIPTLNVTRKAIEPFIAQGTGKTLSELESKIAESKKPVSMVLKNIKASGLTEVAPHKATVRNVAALLPGKGPLAKEFVIVGAHYDHVGMGGEGSLSGGTIAVHNGADDNGSGTISVLEVARQLSKFDAENRRSILFMTFSAEERGLLGSEHYVRHPAIPLEQTVAMVNLDMVGRLGDGSVTVFGMGTAVEFSQWLDEANQTLNVELNKENAGLGPSDHQSFYQRDVPVFHFFTGLHGEYHRPSDDVHLIDFDGISKIALLVTRLTEKLATNKQPPTFAKTQERARIGNNAGKQRPTLGVSFDAAAKDCVVTSVADSSPAKAAGIQAGDVIIKLNDTAITNGESLGEVMKKLKRGDEVVVQVRRAGEEKSLKAKL